MTILKIKFQKICFNSLIFCIIVTVTTSYAEYFDSQCSISENPAQGAEGDAALTANAKETAILGLYMETNMETTSQLGFLFRKFRWQLGCPYDQISLRVRSKIN